MYVQERGQQFVLVEMVLLIAENHSASLLYLPSLNTYLPQKFLFKGMKAAVCGTQAKG
jgi:hypothetical protein